MEDYNRFQSLSLESFSWTSLYLLESALNVVRQRYQNRPLGAQTYPTLAEFSSLQEPLPSANEGWVDYAEKMTACYPNEGDEVTWPLWHLVKGGNLHENIIEAYLGLLRNTYLSMELDSVRPLKSGINRITSEGLTQPTIIPFEQDGNWAFAVAYSDCIHWYDSRPVPEQSAPQLRTTDVRRVRSMWTGPEQSRPNDSGVIMLIGIRQILQATPHLHKRLTCDIAQTFRIRMFIELLTKKINPDQDDFENLVRQRSTSPELGYPTFLRGGFSRAVSTSVHVPAKSNSVPLLSSPAQQEDCNEEATCASQSLSRHGSFSPPPSLPLAIGSRVCSVVSFQERDDRKIILDSLSKAVFRQKFETASTETDLLSLWRLLQPLRRGQKESAFRRRFNELLFQTKLRDGGSHGITTHNMRSFSAALCDWVGLCDLRDEWGEGKYVLLCAIPENLPRLKLLEAIAKVQGQLNDNSDPLSHYLYQAQELCKAITFNSLPSYRLMIEDYQFRKNEQLTDGMYEAFLSLDSRPGKVPIPRQ